MENNKSHWSNLTSKKKEPTELLYTPGSRGTKDSLDKCNSHFSTTGRSLASKTLGDLGTNQQSLADKIKSNHDFVNSFFMQPTDEQEVDRLIMNLHNDKAPGLDRLTNSLIKHI